MGKKISNIGFMPVVESISRKFALRRETCSKKIVSGGANRIIELDPVQYMGAGTRTRNIIGFGPVRQNYFFMRKFARASNVGAEELNLRIKFGTSSKWVADAMKDLSALSPNQQKWAAAVEDPTLVIKGIGAKSYSNMRVWMFAICMAILQASESLPKNHQLPDFDA